MEDVFVDFRPSIDAFRLFVGDRTGELQCEGVVPWKHHFDLRETELQLVIVVVELVLADYLTAGLISA